MAGTPPTIRVRPITDADRQGMIDLLVRCFPQRDNAYWAQALARMAARTPPPDAPRYGYMLEAEARPVGAVLMIMSHSPHAPQLRCNLSSWCIEPAYQLFAAPLVNAALRRRDVTYCNISPAPHTVPVIQAQGFARYNQGQFIAAPALAAWRRRGHARQSEGDDDGIAPHERMLLADHAATGCLCVVAHDGEAAAPFVFQRLRLDRPTFMRLVYCRDFESLRRCAGALGRFLALRGVLFIAIDAEGPLPGVPGVFRAGLGPKYFRGPIPPRLGDLSYTEMTVFGP